MADPYNESWPGDHDFVNYNFGFRYGYDLAAKTIIPLRVEADFTFRDGDDLMDASEEKFRLESFSSLMVQGWLDLPMGKRLRPYVGGGVGLGVVSYREDQGPRKETRHLDTCWSWMLGGGIGWKIADDLILDLGYRLTQSEDFKADFDGHLPTYGFTIKSHDLLLGVRGYF